jgi:hypothetical protein
LLSEEAISVILSFLTLLLFPLLFLVLRRTCSHTNFLLTTAVIAAEGKYRTPNDILKMREQATLHQRHAGGDTANQSTCLLEDALPGDTLFHLAARAFAPEVRARECAKMKLVTSIAD